MTIDLTATGVDYAPPAAPVPGPPNVQAAALGSLVAARNVQGGIRSAGLGHAQGN